jgi:predicted nucleic acid-binding protein
VVRAVLDTNILIDFLHGLPQASAEMALYERPAISAITWIEVMVGTTPPSESGVRAFLQSFELLEMNAEIAERTVLLRKTKRIKLPDAVVWASAQVHQCLLVTRNTKDFDANDPGVRVPYIL